MVTGKSLSNPVFLFILFITGITVLNCQPDEEIIDYDYVNGLEFSTDTVLFDTVFTGIGSATKRLKVYNPGAKALKIQNIRLGKGNDSSYKILINGTEPGLSEELLLLGKDSVLILVEVFIDPKNQNMPYLVRDSIIFETNGIIQDVNLIAWGQDANYLGNEILTCNSTWTSERPYVVYKSILVDTLCQLTIEKGTRIFAAKGAYIYAKGKIIAEGTPEERIQFRNERLEPRYKNIPGQWGGIIFLEGSHDNYLNFTIIRNAEFGIRLGSPDTDTIPDVVVKNTIIENMSNSGILAFNSDLYAENVLVDNCIELNCGNIAGGNYIYRHCTFANYSFDFIRQTPSFYVTDNLLLDDNSSIVEDIFVEIQNSIIYGNFDDEIFFNLDGGADYLFAFNHTIFKTTIEDLDTLNNILNQDPEFIDPAAYNYRLDTLSPAMDKGIFVGISYDLDGNLRDTFPDLGVYERIE